MKNTVLILALSLISTLSLAQKQDDGQVILDKFFEFYDTRGYEYAVRYLWSTNKWIPAGGDVMDNIIQQLSKKVDVMGDFIGQEQIRSRTLGSRIRIVSYLVYYERDPIRFTFVLYKNNEGWEISNFEFDTKFEKELEESMKLKATN